MDDIELTTPLSIDECSARLREAMGDEGLLTWFGTLSSSPVVGRASDRNVRIRKRTCYGNPFQPILVGGLMERDGTTVFQGQFRKRVVPMVPVVAWFTFMILFCGLLFVSALGEILGIEFGVKRGQRSLLWAVPVAFMMLMSGVGTVKLWVWLARDERRFLIDFVAETISSPSVREAGSGRRGQKTGT